VQLSDPSAYEGCDLVFPSFGSRADRTRGSITVFPSFHFHTVTPVYSGVRYAIVGWAHGPTFR
jgi:PKHD-type hydroxylase